MDKSQTTPLSSAIKPDPDDILEIVLGEEKKAQPVNQSEAVIATAALDVSAPTSTESSAETRSVVAGVEAIKLSAPIVVALTDPTSAPSTADFAVAPVAESQEAPKPSLTLLPPPADYVRPWERTVDDDAPEVEYYPVPVAAEVIEEPHENWFGLLLKETIETVVLAVVIFLLIRIGVQNYRIEGSSMEPNFHNGEYLLVNKLAYRLGEYQRGDVIVFKYPGDTTKDYIKRVIGLPGDTVEIRDGVLFVNGTLIEEPYEIMPMNSYPAGPTLVEPGYLYVLGDNRPASSDTRDWGLLDEELVIGKAWLAIYPIQQFGLVDHPALHFAPTSARGP